MQQKSHVIYITISDKYWTRDFVPRETQDNFRSVKKRTKRFRVMVLGQFF